MSNRETELKKLEKEFYILEQAMLNTYNLFKNTKNDNTREKLKKRAQSIQNNMNTITNKIKASKERVVKASKERAAFKRKSNSGFNTPPKKKSAKK